MPTWLYDWNLWWLNFWNDNPYAFWICTLLALLLVLLPRRRVP